MPGDWFNEWVGAYCRATGSGEAIRAVLLASRHTFTVQWSADLTELAAVIRRLVDGGRVPAFPTEITNAIRRELNDLRTETRELPLPEFYEPPKPAACWWCRDTGLVTVPLWRCVEVPRHDPPRLVRHPGYSSVLTGTVLCDRPGCEPGRRVRDAEAKRDKSRPVLGNYLQRFGGVNVVALLEKHEREVAAHSREQPGGQEFAALVRAILKRATSANMRGEAA